MKLGGQVARAVAAVVVIVLISACVSPAARVPCDGRLEPINASAKKPETSNKRPESATPRKSP